MLHVIHLCFCRIANDKTITMHFHCDSLPLHFVCVHFDTAIFLFASLINFCNHSVSIIKWYTRLLSPCHVRFYDYKIFIHSFAQDHLIIRNIVQLFATSGSSNDTTLAHWGELFEIFCAPSSQDTFCSQEVFPKSFQVTHPQFLHDVRGILVMV